MAALGTSSVDLNLAEQARALHLFNVVCMQNMMMCLQCRVLLVLGARSSLVKVVYCVGHKISFAMQEPGCFVKCNT